MLTRGSTIQALARARCLGMGAALAVSGACGIAADEKTRGGAPYAAERRAVAAPGGGDTSFGLRWLDAARLALEEPVNAVLPYAEQGVWLAHEPAALGLAFDAVGGQALRLHLDRAPIAAADPNFAHLDDVYIDVFRVEQEGMEVEHVPLDEVTVDGPRVHARLPESARYVVRLQPRLLTSSIYRLTLELDAALAFPVSGRSLSAVESFFGDPRDAGARRHEGIDIFAARSTPVIAVSDGRAVPQRNDLGGNVVWLNAPGVSYYYAHLEEPAITAPRRVKAGDVLGYVGNSGNAAATPPHLHFGIYRWGHGALDPLPRLSARRFEQQPGTAQPLVRADPSVPTRGLSTAALGAAVGARRDWLKVRSERSSEWIRADYRIALEDREDARRIPAIAGMPDPPVQPGAPAADAGPRTALPSLNAAAEHLIAFENGGSLTGWLLREE